MTLTNRPRMICCLLLAFLSILAVADGVELTWSTEDSIESIRFETTQMKGVFIAHDGRDLGVGYGKHGIRGLTFKGHDLSTPDPHAGGKRRHQGILNLYRVYSATESFGVLRDDEAEVERLEDGARLIWPASEKRPVTISASWHISGSAQIDVHIQTTPKRSIENFEILPAVYVGVDMIQGIYLDGLSGPVLTRLRPQAEYGDPLNYPFYPLNEQARVVQENSGRIHSDWKWKSVVPVNRAVLPMAFAENENVQLLLMAEPESTSAVCVTPTPTSGTPEDWKRPAKTGGWKLLSL